MSTADDGPDEGDVQALAKSISAILGALLVAERAGPPAEGRIPFNPLYFHILRRVSAGEARRPSELAAVLGVGRTTMSTAIKALSGRGLLSSEADPADGRAQILSLTAAGRDVLDAILRQDARNATVMLSMLDPGNRHAFVRAAERIADGLSKVEPAKRT